MFANPTAYFLMPRPRSTLSLTLLQYDNGHPVHVMRYFTASVIRQRFSPAQWPTKKKKTKKELRYRYTTVSADGASRHLSSNGTGSVRTISIDKQREAVVKQ